MTIREIDRKKERNLVREKMSNIENRFTGDLYIKEMRLFYSSNYSHFDWFDTTINSLSGKIYKHFSIYTVQGVSQTL